VTRTAYGMSPEEMSLADAFMEGQRLGMRGWGPEMIEYAPGSPEWHECNRGRLNAIGWRIGGRIAA
jgi:hypothetical protein